MGFTRAGVNARNGDNSEIVGNVNFARPCIQSPMTTRQEIPRMAMLSNLDLIRRVPLFSMLTNDQAQGIADSVVKRRYRRGEIIVEHGRKSNALFILLIIDRLGRY